MSARFFVVAVRRRVRLWAAFAALVALAGWQIARLSAPALAPPRWRPGEPITVTVAIAAEPLRLDPHDARDAPSSLVNFHIYDRLVELGPGGEIVPGLARAWRISPDGTVYTFELRRGVRFHDGLPLTAGAVAANFERLLSPGSTLARAELVRPYVESVAAVDEDTLVIRLRRPLGPFLRYLAHESLGIVSPESIRSAAEGAGFRPAGTGPFALVDWTPGEGVILAAFADHWRGRPKVDRLVFRPIPDGSSRAIAVETGGADVAFPIDPVHMNRLSRTGGVRLVQTSTQRVIYAALNVRRSPLNSPAFRQALNYAVDVEAIARRLLFGAARPLTSPLAEATWGSAAVSPYRYDPGRAQALLAESGAALRPLELWSPSSRYGLDREVAQAIAGYLRQVGLDVKIRLYEWGTYLALLESSDTWDIAVLGWVPASGEADMGLRPLYHSESRGNHSGYRSPGVDALMDEALYETDDGRRRELYRRVQEAVVRDAPSLFLYSVDLVLAHRRDLEGIVVHDTEIVDLRGVRRGFAEAVAADAGAGRWLP